MTHAMTMNQNGIGGLPDVLFPTEGEKSAGNETKLLSLAVLFSYCN